MKQSLVNYCFIADIDIIKVIIYLLKSNPADININEARKIYQNIRAIPLNKI